MMMGSTSRGIRVLVDVMKKLGEVVVVAPDSPQSGMGHAITIGNTLRLSEEENFSGCLKPINPVVLLLTV